MTDNFTQIDAHTMLPPAASAVAVTPHDTNEIAVPRALYIGTGGNMVLVLRNDGTAVTFKNLADGTILPVRPKIVKTTNTTATDIVALY